MEEDGGPDENGAPERISTYPLLEENPDAMVETFETQCKSDEGDLISLQIPISITNSDREAIRNIHHLGRLTNRCLKRQNRVIIVFGIDEIHGYSAARILLKEEWEVVGVAKAEHPFANSEFTTPDPSS